MLHFSKKRIRVTSLMPHSRKSRIRIASFKPHSSKSKILIASMGSCCDSSATSSKVRISILVIQTSWFKELSPTHDLCFTNWSKLTTTTRPKWSVSYSACWPIYMLSRKLAIFTTQAGLMLNLSSHNKKKSLRSVKTRSTNKKGTSINKKGALSNMRKSLKSSRVTKATGFACSK